MSATYTIRELADEFGITNRSIRFYEDRGLLNPLRKGQQRIFDDRQRVRLMLIVRGKRMGFSLDECRQLIDLYDPASGNIKQLRQLQSKIRQKRGQLNRQLEDIRTTLTELDRAEARCQAALNRNDGKPAAAAQQPSTSNR